jgi:hypothetical protein
MCCGFGHCLPACHAMAWTWHGCWPCCHLSYKLLSTLVPHTAPHAVRAVELIRRVSRNISWSEVPDPGPGGMPLASNGSSSSSSAEPMTFSFVCGGTRRVAATINILANRSAGADAECALGAGAFTVTQERLRLGVRFSWCVRAKNKAHC